MRASSYIKASGRVLRLSNLDKVLYPATGMRKRDVLRFYRRIAPWLLPHLKDRPITLKRYPDGVNEPYFYQKRAPDHRPDWIRTIVHHGIQFVAIDDLASLLWVVNLGSIEIHPYLCVGGRSEEATHVVFDLDPGPGAGLLDCARVALALRGRCAAQSLEAFVKSSGGKGLQLAVPLNSAAPVADTKEFARKMAQELERRDPGAVVSRMAKALRPGKVLIDWSQNDGNKTTVSVYSLRATTEPRVSMPLSWDELRRALESADPGLLRFGPREALARLERDGDLFAPVLKLRQTIPGRARAATAA